LLFNIILNCIKDVSIYKSVHCTYIIKNIYWHRTHYNFMTNVFFSLNFYKIYYIPKSLFKCNLKYFTIFLELPIYNPLKVVRVVSLYPLFHQNSITINTVLKLLNTFFYFIYFKKSSFYTLNSTHYVFNNDLKSDIINIFNESKYK